MKTIMPYVIAIAIVSMIIASLCMLGMAIIAWINTILPAAATFVCIFAYAFFWLAFIVIVLALLDHH